MNGYEAAAIRELPDKKSAALPIFAVTANVFDEDRRDAEGSGMNGHITKHIEREELIKALLSVF